jgi:hypothetical protein
MISLCRVRHHRTQSRFNSAKFPFHLAMLMVDDVVRAQSCRLLRT